MTRPVADFLANRVFCILDDPGDDSPRVTASEFGTWIKNLPALLGGNHGMHRTISNSSTGHPIAPSTPLSHRPTSRNPSNSTRVSRTPALVARSLSRAPSLGPAYEREEASQLSTVYDHEEDEEQSQEVEPVPVPDSAPQPILEEKEIEQEHGDNDPVSTKSTKRRKRGLRKGKAAAAAAAANASGTPTATMDETLATLTIASQELAREISKASRVSSTKSTSTKASTPSSARVRTSYEPVSMFGMPKHLCTGSKNAPASMSSVPASSTVPVPVKKSSIWKLSFGKQNVSVSTSTVASPVEEVPPDVGSTQSQTMSTTASHVTGLIMSLNAPTVPVVSSLPVPVGDRLSARERGRCGRGSPTTSMKSTKSSSSNRAPSGSPHKSDAWSFGEKRSERGASPNSTRSGRSGRPLASSTCCSIASGNWRNSTSTSSSAGTSTSAFTRYSNSSNRSISTTATSVSSTSWRASGKGPQSSASSTYSNYPALSKNVKGECCRSTHCIVFTDASDRSHVWCSVGTSAAASCSISE